MFNMACYTWLMNNTELTADMVMVCQLGNLVQRIAKTSVMQVGEIECLATCSITPTIFSAVFSFVLGNLHKSVDYLKIHKFYTINILHILISCE